MMKQFLAAYFFCCVCILQIHSQIVIDPSETYQTIEGFAASDCWNGNYVGQYWQETAKNMIAKLLFSQNLKTDGSPEGIGLSMWRFNLGAGTIEQGAASGINDISRRAECFLDESGVNYDWTKQAGQQFFLKKAKEYGCEQFVAFSNSPLVVYTKNGKGYSKGDGYSNLKEDKYDGFADYLATVAEHFEREAGITFNYISPVNEPQYEWKDSTQEGTPWHNSEIKKLVVELDKAITNKGLKNTKILVAEAGAWDYLYLTKGNASNQIYQFFDAKSENYIGDLPSVAPVIAAHSYWTHTSNALLRNVRTQVKYKAKSYQLKVFQTEWSMLDGGEGIPNFDAASYMDLALFTAKIVHSDLAYANASSWSYWTAMDAERWSHKNRFLLIALAPGGDFYGKITTSGNVYERSTLWALGNYSFFIRPGYQRIKLQGADNLSDLFGTAYIAPDQSKIVAVYVNMAYEVKKISSEFKNMPGLSPVKQKVYVTSSGNNLRKVGGTAAADIYDPNAELSIPARSVTTVVYELGPTSGISVNQQATVKVYPTAVAVGGDLNIAWPELDGDHNVLSIYSPQGQLYFSQQLESGITQSITLPLHLRQGVYILKIQSSNITVLQTKLLIH